MLYWLWVLSCTGLSLLVGAALGLHGDWLLVTPALTLVVGVARYWWYFGGANFGGTATYRRPDCRNPNHVGSVSCTRPRRGGR